VLVNSIFSLDELKDKLSFDQNRWQGQSLQGSKLLSSGDIQEFEQFLNLGQHKHQVHYDETRP
jgi:hypothetical protein